MKSNFTLSAWQTTWYMVIFILGLVGNGIVIFVIMKSKTIQRDAPFNIYLLALAIIDMLISIICVPTYALSTDAFLHPSGEYGEVLCKLVTGYTIPFWLLDVSVFLLVAIAVERRKAIIDSFSTLQYRSIKLTLSYVGIALLMGILTQAPTYYGAHYESRNATVGNACKYDCGSTTMDILHYSAFTLECIVPSIVLFICFRHIKKHLTKFEGELHHSIPDYYKAKNKKFIPNIAHKKDTIGTFKIIVIVFLVCVALNEITYVLLEPVLNITSLQWNSSLYQVTVMLRFSNSCLNPILYSFRSKSFRKKVRDVFNDMTLIKMLKIRKENQINMYTKFSNVI
ncbi:apelin receptor B-like isoform X1 [Hydractinia symbiolongicarpus]|uniref:apelin receptor B-like isoform X1 n=2 Tax=Hydractinia symbiolongicarpus TaxID=13093 RepID=UPI00254A93C0|nr:apelin receptor B-like isoform X1 [Hydractinia symbiolongicarpus]